MKAQNKTIIVTGGGSGMGQAMVLELLNRGAYVIAIDINENGLKETKELSGEKEEYLDTYVVDIADRYAIEQFADKMFALHERIDGIINNAGIIQPFVKVNDLSYEAIEKVFYINFYGTLYIVKTFLPHLLTRPEAHIVNISSMGGFLPVPGQTIYGASKAAVKLLTEGLHSELAGTNIKITVVFPGAVKTNISKNSGLNNPRAAVTAEAKQPKTLSAEKAAKIIINGMESDSYRVLVGKDSKMMDGFYRLAPQGAASLIARKMKRLLS
jgi:short-subunit dehydrogenase